MQNTYRTDRTGYKITISFEKFAFQLIHNGE